MEYDDDTQKQTPSDAGVKIEISKMSSKEQAKFWKELGKRVIAGEPLAALAEETGIQQSRLVRKRQSCSWWAWDAIKEAACLGVPFKELSRKFGPSPDAIRKRATMEVWPTPRKIGEIINQRATGSEAGEAAEMLEKQQVGIFEPLNPQGTLEEIAKAYELGMAKMAMDKARSGIIHAPTPKNWRDIKTADDIARRAAGLGKDAGKVATLFKVGFGNPGEPTIDVGVVVDLPSDDEA